ncbi:tRNA (guanosine(46)-N7)-methyltransferase TrmB [Mammaliicoccus lentus]|uniref:tRNA (guanosine(46)-N7)-methyltransferase TrmB n=1 Tax=Mammaliicoccus lentus TaxID=42858 RepID=UPI003CE90330
MRMRNKPWADDFLKSHPQIVDVDLNQQYKMAEWFEKDQPIHIEVGTGMGRFITEMARRHPEINYVAIERDKNVMVRVLEKVKELELENIKLINQDAKLLTEYIVENEVSRIYLNFSDPWPKTRHTKRRLTFSSFLEIYRHILKKDGQIHFKTDNQGLFEYSLESMSAFGMTFDLINLNLHENEPEENIRTEYEDKFSNRGFRIYRMEASFK